jgi:hypothetical protein
MSSLLALHMIAAERGEGLHPKLLEALRREETSPTGEPTAMTLRSLSTIRPCDNENSQGLARPANHVSNPAVVITPASSTAS